jgi:benzodiazapine receptor
MQKYLLLITALVTIGLTSLVSVPGSPYLIGGYTQADISAMFSTAITPAGLTFSIWSLIYLSWVIAWVYVAFFQKQKTNPPALQASPLNRRAIPAFSLAIALTAVWLFPWGNLYIGVALIVMLAILGLLTYVFTSTRMADIVVRSSIELTLAWIIMATALNVTVWMLYMWWSIGGPTDLYYAIGALGWVALIVAYLQCRYRSYIISAVLLWTLIGVYIAHPIFEQQVMVGIYALITVVNMIYAYTKRR